MGPWQWQTCIEAAQALSNSCLSPTKTAMQYSLLTCQL
jgi:hypothetical protein